MGRAVGELLGTEAQCSWRSVLAAPAGRCGLLSQLLHWPVSARVCVRVAGTTQAICC